MQRSVRSVPVVMLDVFAQYDVEVAWSDDQEVVEAFPAQGADELDWSTSSATDKI